MLQYSSNTLACEELIHIPLKEKIPDSYGNVNKALRFLALNSLYLCFFLYETRENERIINLTKMWGQSKVYLDRNLVFLIEKCMDLY